MLRTLIANGLLAGMSLAFLWHFSNIWHYGQYSAQEPNILIRSLETVMFLAILGFSVYNIIVDFSRRKQSEEAKVKPEECPKLDDCPKITMILDKDLLDFQYAEAIRAVCAKCDQGNGETRRSSQVERDRP